LFGTVDFLPLGVSGLTKGFVFREDFLTSPVNDTAGSSLRAMSDATSCGLSVWVVATELTKSGGGVAAATNFCQNTLFAPEL
jgi:hypothetical protein